ncbi:MAG: hypothetical protein LVS60_05400 [Nodosilinea sp. LVE1205-7]|jgi:hypothetical protein
MEARDCRALLGVIQAFIRMAPHSDQDLADLMDLLGQLEQGQKRDFWAWLGENAPNVKKWLMAKGGSYRRAA